jgi:hypothetical protein
LFCPAIVSASTGSTEAGADLQHAAVFVHSGALCDLARHPRGGQKILPFGFGKSESVLGQQEFHIVYVTQVHKKHAFRLLF